MQLFSCSFSTFLEQAKQKFIAAGQAFAVDPLHALDVVLTLDVMTINIPLWSDLLRMVRVL